MYESSQLCPACGQSNGCAMAAGKSASACWCMGTDSSSLPKLPVPGDDSACYCEHCLRKIRSALQNSQGTTP